MKSVELHYEQAGDPSHPTIVFCPALGTNAHMWDKQARRLQRDYHVVQLDLRGHGESPSPRGPYSIAELGLDLIALLDRLEIERAHLAGISLGGMIGLWVAANEPRRVDRLAVVCTAAYLEAKTWWLDRARSARRDGLAAIAAGTPVRWFTAEMRRERPTVVQAFEHVNAITDPEGYASCCEAIAAIDLRPDLSRVEASTLVIAGEEDVATPPELGRYIADHVADSSFVALPRAAHLANVERSHEVAVLLAHHFE